MNIAIVGLGKFGKELIKYLSKYSYNIMAIDRNETLVNDCVNDYDIQGFVGNGASYSTLLEAGISSYDLLIAVTSSDEVNILSCLVAKKLGIKHTIARVRNPEYDKESCIITGDLGLDLIINPDTNTATEILRVLRFPGALKVESFGDGSVDLIECKIDPNSLLIGKSLFEMQASLDAKILVCIVERDDKVFIPKGDFKLEENDHIYITATKENLKKMFKKLGANKNRTYATIIIGGGKTSYYLASMLIDNGIQVKIVEKNKEVCKRLSEQLPEAIVLCSDGTNQQLLLEEGIEENSLVALTDVDETNIVISSYAKSVNAKKVITKVSNSNYSDLLDTIGLDSIVSPKEVFASNIIRYVRALENDRSSECKSLYRLVDNRVEALEFVIREDTKYTNIKLKDLKVKEEFIIAAIIRNHKVIIPGGFDELRKDDSVIIVTTNINTKDLSEIVE